MGDNNDLSILPTNQPPAPTPATDMDEAELDKWKKALQRMPSRLNSVSSRKLTASQSSPTSSDDDAARRSAMKTRTATMVTQQLTQKSINMIKCPIQLNWENLTLEVITDTGSKRRILKGLTGYMAPGNMCAIMGPSGCGKTTIMTVLADKNPMAKGTVLANQKPLTESYKTIMGYVPQDDVFLPNLTVREQLMFSAGLRLPKWMTASEKEERVKQVMGELGLNACAETRIGGGLTRGVSGGERKRCAIGVELLSNPSVLFLDEPTSGLDAYTSQNLIESLAKLADQNRTIMMSIHQPRATIFQLFDILCLMSAGEFVYLGPGAPKVMEYFADLGYKCPDFTNPADYLTDILTAENTKRLNQDPKVSADTKVGELVAKFKTHTLADPKTFPQGPTEEVTGVSKADRVTIATEQKELFKRSFLNYYRDPTTVFAKVVSGIVMGLLMGSLFYQISNSQTGVQDRMGGCFLLIMSQTLPVAITVITLFPTDAAVFFREHDTGMYRTSTYFLAKFITELPGNILIATVQCSIIYWMMGFQADAGRFFYFLWAIWLTNNASASLGFILSVLAPNVAVANTLVPVIVVIFLLFSGFLVNSDNLPKYYIWIQYSSYIKYAFSMVITNEFHGRTFDCPYGVCAFATGDDLLDNYSLDWSDRYSYMASLIIIAAGFWVLGYAALRIKVATRTVV